jgi:hypothetical protein
VNHRDTGGHFCNYGCRAHLAGGLDKTPGAPRLTDKVNVYMVFLINA